MSDRSQIGSRIWSWTGLWLDLKSGIRSFVNWRVLKHKYINLFSITSWSGLVGLGWVGWVLACVDLVQVAPYGWSPLDSWYSCHFGSVCHLGQVRNLSGKHSSYFFGSQCKIQGKINAQINFGHNFLLEGPTDLRSTPLSHIFHALFRDTPLGYAQHTWPNSQISKYLADLAIWLLGCVL